MTWLFVPGISSPSAQASEDLNSASCSLSTIGERLAEASATWRGKEQPPQAWSRRWKQGGFIRLLSGLTCSPSTLDHGVAQFISSLRATPARTTASPESEQGQMESDSSPPKSPALPKSAGLILSSERTSRGTRTDSLKPSSRHWKGWAIALRQEYSVRPKPVIPCDASDCSSWPAPAVMDTGDSTDPQKILNRRERHKARGINGNGFGVSLSEAAGKWNVPPVEARDAWALSSPEASHRAAPIAMGLADEWRTPQCGDSNRGPKSQRAEGHGYRDKAGMHSLVSQSVTQTANWSSPKASDPEKAGPNMRGSKGDVPLPGQAARWAAPAAQNHKGSSEGSITRADGKSREDILSYQAEQFFRPPSSLDQPIAGGSMSSTDSPNSNQPSVKRKLNPIFVEALMRWPTGLSGFERQEMASIPSLLPTHFCVCKRGCSNERSEDL